MDPERWQPRFAEHPTGIGPILRALRPPQSPGPDDLARLATLVDQISRRPASRTRQRSSRREDPRRP